MKCVFGEIREGLESVRGEIRQGLEAQAIFIEKVTLRSYNSFADMSVTTAADLPSEDLVKKPC